MKLPRRNFLHLAAGAAALSGVWRIARAQDYLAVHPSLGVNSIAELVALSKQRSGLSYATSGEAGLE
jgi:hypothetical protein